MKLKNKEIYEIFNRLKTLERDKGNKSVKYILNSARIKKKLYSEIESIEEAKPKLAIEFQNKNNEIILKYAEKNSDGRIKTYETPTNPNVTKLENIVISDENREKMNAEIKELEESRDLDAENKEQIEFNELLNDEIEVDIKPFTEDMVYEGINETAFMKLVELGIWELGDD